MAEPFVLGTEPNKTEHLKKMGRTEQYRTVARGGPSSGRTVQNRTFGRFPGTLLAFKISPNRAVPSTHAKRYRTKQYRTIRSGSAEPNNTEPLCRTLHRTCAVGTVPNKTEQISDRARKPMGLGSWHAARLRPHPPALPPPSPPTPSPPTQ